MSHSLQTPIGIITLQPDQIKVSNHWRSQFLHQIVLCVEVIFEQLFVGASSDGAGFRVVGLVVVDGDGVDVVHGADEEVEGVGGKGLLD